MKSSTILTTSFIGNSPFIKYKVKSTSILKTQEKERPYERSFLIVYLYLL
ncbi:hypothetical protein LLID5_07600 [Lactococcus lactis]|nr:hypothetical protein LLID5_07600 [Lactococcus lactis]